MDLPWSEDYMLRQSHPMYDDWCRDDEGEDNYDKEAAEEALADLRKEY